LELFGLAGLFPFLVRLALLVLFSFGTGTGLAIGDITISWV
jgi:hypothetical protein